MIHQEKLKEWLEQNAISVSHHEYAGINDLSLEQLGSLLVLTQAAIAERINNQE